MGSDRDNDGAYLIDRSPIFFEHILNYLRTNKLIYETRSQLQGIQLEAEFYNLQVSFGPQIPGLIPSRTTLMS